jgi:S-DNA-T family DNA segregation ATPase FtsK/SpoIIIE
MSFVRNLSARRQNEILGILLMALGALVFISLLSYSPASDYLLSTKNFGDPTENLTGPVGQLIASALVLIFGYCSYFIPLMLVLWGINRFLGTNTDILVKRTLYLTGLMIFLGALAGLIYPMVESPDGQAPARALQTGGMVGSAMAFLLWRYFHMVGAYMVTITALLVLGCAATGLRLRSLAAAVGIIFAGLLRWLRNAIQPAPQTTRRGRPATARARAHKDARLEKKKRKAQKLRRKLDSIQAEVEVEEHPPEIVKPKEALSKETEKIKPTVLPSGAEYRLPPLSLLYSPPKEDKGQNERELFANAEILESKLADFDVEGKVVQVSPGPVITRYEVKPAPGVKVNRFVNLADDLALAMRAQRIRVVAPIPGKDAVGIEIPNKKPSVVYIREMLSSTQFQQSSSKLSLALGKTIAGESYCTDLARMPHMLIAGATGSGKSVCIHSIIASILFRATPEEVRFLLIDPKMLELTVFNNIPHLFTPVVVEPKEAVKVLRWAVTEMERRYQVLAKAAVRNIDAYNAKRRQGLPLPGTESARGTERLPYIVIIVDELADLMLTVSNEIEDTIGRLAQMARAVGIHLVLATQRPSVDVITGVIKANFPTRIAFQVASKTDSRTILDMNGAEKLLGRGDMLFLPPGRPEAVRLHGSFISAEETESLASFLAGQGISAEHLEDLEEHVAAATLAAEKDDLFDEALRLVVRHQQGSVSLLQRRLKIGYARAGRLMDQLEAAGIVGPFDGSKARQVLVDPAYLDNLETGDMTSL